MNNLNNKCKWLYHYALDGRKNSEKKHDIWTKWHLNFSVVRKS
jgi:hypothetical protein